MNNTLIMKNSDFSGMQVGKINLQKIDIIKQGNDMYMATGGALSNDWSGFIGIDPVKDGAYSQEIDISNINTNAYIYGRFNISVIKSNADKLINGDFPISPAYFTLFHRTYDNTWQNFTLTPTNYNKPNILRVYKDAFYKTNIFSIFLIEGLIFQGNLTNMDKLLFSWIRPDSANFSGLGIEVPELYIGLE